MEHSYHIPGVRAEIDLMRMTFLREDDWCITRVTVARNLRGQGIASRLLQMVTDAADAEGVTLYLADEPGDATGLPHDALVQWYARNGFETFTLVTDFGTDENVMRRTPQTPLVSPQRSAGSDDATTRHGGT